MVPYTMPQFVQLDIIFYKNEYGEKYTENFMIFSVTYLEAPLNKLFTRIKMCTIMFILGMNLALKTNKFQVSQGSKAPFCQLHQTMTS